MILVVIVFLHIAAVLKKCINSEETTFCPIWTGSGFFIYMISKVADSSKNAGIALFMFTMVGFWFNI